MMLELSEGKVIEIISHRAGLTKVELEIEGEIRRAIHYKQLLGAIKVGDKVIVNTAANTLELGTGGYDFIVCILGQQTSLAERGHIMKLRYTPYQLQTCTLAEQQSFDHRKMKEVDSLAGTPVVVGTLHSMLPAIAAVIKSKDSEIKIAYIMTDGAALPIAFSDLVYHLKENRLIDFTITCGHSFGGDLEAVNIYSALLGAYLKQAEVIIVTMGPGIVGTGTKYGFSGTEQVDILHAVSNLGGCPIAVPRINFSDSRKRHYGISHHSKTNLGQLTLIKSLVGLPNFNGEQKQLIDLQLKESKIAFKHKLIYKRAEYIIEELENLDFKLSTMGKGVKEVPEYFKTAGVAGAIAVERV
ncbi:MAG: DUF3866 family protein [Bacillota bacterium]